MIPLQIRKMVEIFSHFPTIGERTATRFALYLLSLSEQKTEEICKSITSLKKEIKRCPLCQSSFSSPKQKICQICSDKKREKTLCVVEKETDLWQMEKTKQFQGFYFILGGKIEFLKENSLGKVRIEALKERVEKLKPKEIILALNPTPDGILTMDFIKRTLKSLTFDKKGTTAKVTCLGRGLPMGGELEYADEETLKDALNSRK